jgi:hypothetical protein
MNDLSGKVQTTMADLQQSILSQDNDLTKIRGQRKLERQIKPDDSEMVKAMKTVNKYNETRGLDSPSLEDKFKQDLSV